MKFALACYGTRGDIEPCVAVGRELLRRGHEVRMAVPPELVGFAEAAGLAAVAYGPDSRSWQDLLRDFLKHFFRNFWTIRDPIRLRREAWEPVTQYWAEMSTTLTSLADGADLLFTGADLPGDRCQRRGVLRHSLGHAALLPDAGQRPARSDPAVAVDPLRNDGVRVGVLAHNEKGRGRAAP